MSKTVIEYPITYIEACDHLNVEEGQDESLIRRLIRSATALAEEYIEQDIALKEYVITGTTKTGVVTFGVTNFRSVELLKVDDTVVEDFTDITINDNGFTRTIQFDISTDEVEYEIKYRAGFTEYEVEDSIKTAIFLKIGELYDVDRSNYVLSNYRQSNAFQTILNYHKPIFYR